MVGMAVRKEHRVEPADAVLERLHAELRPGVYDNVSAGNRISRSDIGAASEAFVLFVAGSAHFAPAANHRYAVAGARPHKNHLHGASVERNKISVKSTQGRH